MQSALFSNNTSEQNGGALLILNPTDFIRFDNVTSLFNRAKFNGGSLCVIQPSSYLTVTRSTFGFNSAINGGGVFYDSPQQALEFTDNEFTGNTAQINGAAIHVSMANPPIVVTSNRFTNNSASLDGGGIYVIYQQERLEIRNSTFEGNEAFLAGGGVAVIVSDNIIDLAECTFASNSATMGGAIYVQNSSSLIDVRDIAFRDNFADQQGGAISVIGKSDAGPELLLNGTTWRGNRAIIIGGGDVYAQYVFRVSVSRFDSEGSEGNIGGSLHVKSGSYLEIADSSFEASLSHQQGSALYCEGVIRVSVVDSVCRNSIGFDGTLYVVSGEELTVRSTRIDSNSVEDNGGGVIAEKVRAVSLHDLAVTNNTALNDAGGLLLRGIQELRIGNLSCVDNRAVDGNGGCALWEGVHELDLTTHTQNITRNSAGRRGGGVYVRDLRLASYTITNLSLTHNAAGESGGGLAFVHCAAQQVTILDVVFAGNSAGGSGGGGLFAEDVLMILVHNSTFERNSAHDGAAVQISSTNTNAPISQYASISQSTFTHNGASNFGGAVHVQFIGQYVILVGNLFQNNTAKVAGAVILTLQRGAPSSDLDDVLVSRDRVANSSALRRALSNASDESEQRQLYVLKNNSFLDNEVTNLGRIAVNIRIISNESAANASLPELQQLLE